MLLPEIVKERRLSIGSKFFTVKFLVKKVEIYKLEY